MTLPKDIADDLSEPGSATLGRDIMSSRPRGRRFAMRMFDLPTSHIYRLRIIDEGGLDLRMSHQLHEGWQAHAGSNHIRGEGVSETVRVGNFDAGGPTMMAKQ